jgi:hypothetical protein
MGKAGEGFDRINKIYGIMRGGRGRVETGGT